MKGLSKRKLMVAAVSIAAFTGVGFLATNSLASTRKDATSNQISHVSLTASGAEPNVIAIPIGHFVQFDAKDGRQHMIGQGGGDNGHHGTHQVGHDHTTGGQNSDSFGPDEGYRVQFHQPGTFTFHDHFNPAISVTVVVFAANRP